MNDNLTKQILSEMNNLSPKDKQFVLSFVKNIKNVNRKKPAVDRFKHFYHKLKDDMKANEKNKILKFVKSELKDDSNVNKNIRESYAKLKDMTPKQLGHWEKKTEELRKQKEQQETMKVDIMKSKLSPKHKSLLIDMLKWPVAKKNNILKL